MNNIDTLSRLVGNTPLVRISYRYKGNLRNVYAKLEWYNLTGSIKDRVALAIIEQAYKDGSLGRGQEIVEVTSGNMGISLTAIGVSLGHKVTVFMPKFMSDERKKLLVSYGANLVLTDSFNQAFALAESYATSNRCFVAHQFENTANVSAHYNTTAVEILHKLPDVSAFVAGVGTSGTLTGIGTRLKQERFSKVFALEPEASSLLTLGYSKGEHKIQGLSDNVIPKLYDKTLVDGIVSVSDEDAIAMAQKLCGKLALAVGISGGANFVGAVLTGLDNVVTVFPDDNKKYLSTSLCVPTFTELTCQVELLDVTVV